MVIGVIYEGYKGYQYSTFGLMVSYSTFQDAVFRRRNEGKGKGSNGRARRERDTSLL